MEEALTLFVEALLSDSGGGGFSQLAYYQSMSGSVTSGSGADWISKFGVRFNNDRGLRDELHGGRLPVFDA